MSEYIKKKSVHSASGVGSVVTELGDDATPNYALSYSDRSIFLNGRRIADFANMSLTDIGSLLKLKDAKYRKNPRAKPAIAFKTLCDALGLDLDKALSIFDGWMEDYLVKEGEKPAMVVETVETSVEDMRNLSMLDELIALVALSPSYKFRNPPWVLLVGAPSSGKDTHLELIRDDRLSVFVTRTTDNALLPGTASDDVELHSLFEEINGKVLVFPDLATVLGEKESVVNKFFGLHTGAYGKDEVAVFSPGGGLKRISTRYSCLWGITPHLYRAHVSQLNRMGNRFLVYKLPHSDDPMWESNSQGEFDLDRKKKLMISRILSCKGKPLPSLDESLLKWIEQQAAAVVRARCIYWADDIDDVESVARLANQMRNLARLRELFSGKRSFEDHVAFLRAVTMGTIPYLKELEEVCTYPNSSWEKGSVRDVLKEHLRDLGIRFTLKKQFGWI